MILFTINSSQDFKMLISIDIIKLLINLIRDTSV